MTIAAILIKHQEEIFEPLEYGDIETSRQAVLKLLACEELKDNKDVPKAKKIFEQCKGKTNLYLSTLGTYTTCMKLN